MGKSRTWLIGVVVLIMALFLTVSQKSDWFGLSEQIDAEVDQVAETSELARSNRARKEAESLTAKQAYARLLTIADAEMKKHKAGQLAVPDRSSIDLILNNPNRVEIDLYDEELKKIEALVAILSEAEWRQIAKRFYYYDQEAVAVDFPPLVQSMVDFSIERMASSDPKRLIAWLKDQGCKLNDLQLRSSIALGWAEHEPRAALAFWKSDQYSLALSLLRANAFGWIREHQIFTRIAEYDAATAMEIVREQPFDERAVALRGLVQGLSNERDLRSSVNLLGELPWSGKTALTEDESIQYQNLTLEIGVQWAKVNPEAAIQWYENFTMHDRSLADSMHLEQHYEGKRMTFLYELADQDPQKLMAWARGNDYSSRKQAAKALGQNHYAMALEIAQTENNPHQRIELVKQATSIRQTLLSQLPSIGRLFPRHTAEDVRKMSEDIQASKLQPQEKKLLLKWLESIPRSQ
ncbi:MAG: hypothetical protein ACPG6P_02525 [Akkermansiaceae bacterium]